MNEKFKKAIALAESESSDNKIGTLKEKLIHKTLKHYYSGATFSGLNQEVKIGRFFADVVGENGIIEIQTRAFYKLIPKLNAFLPVCPVTIVYPFEKRINYNTRTVNRKDLTKFFLELYSIRTLLKHTKTETNLTVCIASLEINKFPNKTKHPVDLLSEIYLKEPSDYKIFLPDKLPDVFTRAEFAKNSCCAKDGPLINILELMGLVKKNGKVGRCFLYSLS